MNRRNRLIGCALKYQGDYAKVLKAYNNHEDIVINSDDVRAITIFDKDYPASFHDLKEPPLVLFYHGKRALLNTSCISVVGSRIVSDYGRKMTELIVGKLVGKYTIVSGLAKGVDGIAHQSALKGGSTIGILGCGIDYIYPIENRRLFEEMKNNHLIISEYPNDGSPSKRNFPWRNRLIAALSSSVIITQAKVKSGTMLTVNEALKMNRDIYVVPYRLDDYDGQGCNQLILEGANILLTEHIDML